MYVSGMDGISLSVASEAAQRQGVQGTPQLIRSGANDVYSVGEFIVRVSRSEADVGRDIAIVAFLKLAGVPVPEPVEAGEIDGVRYSLWEYVRSHQSGSIDFRSFGEGIRALHALSIDSFADFDIPWCDELDWLNVDHKLAEARSVQALSNEDLECLEAHADRLRSWGERCRSVDPLVICHGDVHPQNVIMRDSQAVIIDWDTICVGPQQWDHAALMTWSDRWGGAASDYGDFTEGYGESFKSDPLAMMLAEVRLLAPTVNLVLRAAGDQRFTREAELRMRYWRNDPDAPPWSAQ